MAGYKINRMSEDIRRELMDILRSMKDPRGSGGMLSVVRIELSGDASCCKVYVSALEGLDAAKVAVKVLQNAQGFVRKELSARIEMRRAPELRFIADNSIEHSADIERILHQIGEE